MSLRDRATPRCRHGGSYRRRMHWRPDWPKLRLPNQKEVEPNESRSSCKPAADARVDHPRGGRPAAGVAARCRLLVAQAPAVMTDSRLVLAVSLAAATPALLLAVIAMGGALRAGLGPWPGIAVVVMATAAFVLSWERGSFLVAGLLAASGAVGLVYGLMATEFFAAATFPGPVFGIIIGLPLLVLGVAHGVKTAQAGSR
jgi:hypothetical protein